MIRFLAHHPTAANLMMMLFIVLGVASLPGLKRETMPDFTVFKAKIDVAYPGASAEEIEEAVCQRIEDALDGVQYVAEVLSEARENIGSVQVEMMDGGDFVTFLADIETEVDAIDDFPDATEDAIISKIGFEDQVVSFAVTGDMSPTHLLAYCEDLQVLLRRNPKVSLVEIRGFSQRQIRIEFDAHALQRYGLSIDEVAHTISEQNVDLPAGTIENAQRHYLIRFNEQRKSPREYEDLIVIAGDTGAELRLGDVATITDRFELDEDKIYFNGRRAGILKIEKTKSEDALTVVSAVRTFIAEQEDLKPKGVEFTITEDVSSIVQDRLSLLLRNGWQGMILVFLVMWLFFNIRLSFWVVMGLPVSFLGAFFFLPLFGMSINMLTMVALLLALGLLMDDAIVIAENVAARMKGGSKSHDAAVEGTVQVSRGVLSSFATTACVFVPLSFLAGDMGRVLQVVPVVLIIVLSVSLIEAFGILPHHLANSLRDDHSHEVPVFRQRFNAFIEWLRHSIAGTMASAAVRYRYLTIGLVVGVFIASIGMVASGRIGFVPFPDLDGDVVQARLLMPQGTPLTRTESVVRELERTMLEVDEEFSKRQRNGQRLVQNYSVQYNVNPDSKESGPHIAMVSVDLLSTEERDGTIDEIKAAWRARMPELPDVVSLVFKEPAIGPSGLPIEIRLQGDDLDDLKQASLAVQKWYGERVGVVNLSDDMRPGKPELRIRLREGAVTLGVHAKQVADQIRSAFYGTTASEVQIGRQNYEVDVRMALGDRGSFAGLEYFMIRLASGKLAPLSTLATAEETRGFARIARIDGLRTVTVSGDVDNRYANAAELMRQFKRAVLPKLNERFPSVTLGLEGQEKESQATGASMMRGMIFGLIGVFMLLSLQFRSYLEPLVVMCAIPLSFIGVIWGHWLMGLPLTMPSMLGFVSLTGIVVNDSILLVEFVTLRRREGMGVEEASLTASRDRFRAVLLTSATTIAGLIPLLLEKSMQAQILIPLVTSIVFGLMASTLLILLVVPSGYTIFADLGWVRKKV